MTCDWNENMAIILVPRKHTTMEDRGGVGEAGERVHTNPPKSRSSKSSSKLTSRGVAVSQGDSQGAPLPAAQDGGVAIREHSSTVVGEYHLVPLGPGRGTKSRGGGDTITERTGQGKAHVENADDGVVWSPEGTPVLAGVCNSATLSS